MAIAAVLFEGLKQIILSLLSGDAGKAESFLWPFMVRKYGWQSPGEISLSHAKIKLACELVTGIVAPLTLMFPCLPSNAPLLNLVQLIGGIAFILWGAFKYYQRRQEENAELIDKGVALNSTAQNESAQTDYRKL